MYSPRLSLRQNPEKLSRKSGAKRRDTSKAESLGPDLQTPFDESNQFSEVAPIGVIHRGDIAEANLVAMGCQVNLWPLRDRKAHKMTIEFYLNKFKC